jgi:glycosyltransferase involved in cell wall biosynthesis
MARNNKVSAVIPTRNRPDLVLRAVRSALSQTYKDLEVVVVVDGPDDRTVKALADVCDDRLQIIVLPRTQGAPNARNVGVGAAQGDWIAFLDDDDEWLPDKTAQQMDCVGRSAFMYPIVSSQVFARTSSYQLIWPRKQPCEPLSEYLLARNSCSRGEGFLSTITLLFPKDLFPLVPFSPSWAQCDDVDWVLRASRQAGVGIEFIPQPLAIVHLAEDRISITTVPNWRASLDWVESVRGMITARAYASYLAITVASQAVRQGDWSAFPFLLRRILTRGAPKPRDLAFFVGVWCVPRKVQLAVRKAGW